MSDSAVRTDADEQSLRRAIDEAIARSDANAARGLLGDLWRNRPGPALAAFVVSRFEKLREALRPAAVKVFLLRSCTFEHVVPILRAAAFTLDVDLDVKVGDFNSYAQEILNPASPLYRSSPDVVLLAVHTADVAPDLWEGFADLSKDQVAAAVDRVAAGFRNWIRTFREHSQAHLVVHGLELPNAASYGVLDGQIETSQRDALTDVNRAITAIAREHRGVYVLDYDGLVARSGRDSWHDPRKWLTMRVPLRAERMHGLASEWLRFIHPLKGKTCKALVVDLDNTLWGGVIGEDGLTGIKIGKDYPGGAFLALQRAILDLYQRGIILAVCSKNNPADALEALQNHPGMLLRPQHFAALRMNWEDKARNLRAIASELNIGLDALAFLDDNPAERALVKSHLPEVTVIELPADPMEYARTLRGYPVFERVTWSAEDRERGRLYAEERQRTELQERTGSLEEFYRSLEMSVTVARVSAETVARTSQLTQKTNQFNLTTRRYTEQQILAMASDPAVRVHTISARDRFGDNGLVGVAIVRQGAEVCELDTLLLSCRVIGRTIETALLSTIAADAKVSGATRLRGEFIATKKNAPSRDFFPDHGFTCVRETDGATTWELDLSSALPACPAWIALASTE